MHPERNKYMKQTATALLFFSILFFSSPGQYYLPWNFHNYLNDLQQSGESPDMLIDNAGGIHISFWNKNEDRLVYTYKNPGSSVWNFELVDSFNLCGFKSSIALDPGGNICIAYFYSDLGSNSVAFAKRISANNWQIQNLPGNNSPRDWGDYGRYSSHIQTEDLRHSIDLAFAPNGEPTIAFFDAWYSFLPEVNCNGAPYGYYQDYDFKMVKAWRTGSTWNIYKFPKFSDISQSCVGENLPDGDRFGETCNVLYGLNGKEYFTTHSYSNNRILLYEKTSGDTLFQSETIDSFYNIFPCLNTPNLCCLGNNPSNPAYVRYWHTLESVSSAIGTDGRVHMVYCSSTEYGRDWDPYNNSGFNGLCYSNVDSSGNIFQYNFYPSTCPYKPYYTLTSIEAKGADSVFIAFSDKTNFVEYVATSLDTGHTWVIDTIALYFPHSPPVIRVFADTIRVAIYNPDADQLLLYSKRMGTSNWLRSPITLTQNRGASLDAKTRVVAGDTVVSIGFNDSRQGNLFFGKGVMNNGIFNWTTEHLDSTEDGFDQVKLIEDSGGNPVMIYHDLETGDLALKRKVGVTWQTEIIIPACAPNYISVIMDSQDSIHLAWYSNQSASAWYGVKLVTDATWQTIELIDSNSGPAGIHLSLNLDNNGIPEVAYHTQGNSNLVHAKRMGVNNWVTEPVDSNISGQMGYYTNIKTGNGNRPVISYRDHFANVLYLAEKTSAGTWTRSVVENSGGDNIGAPNSLWIDPGGNPWVAYNFSLGFDRIRLKMRDTTGWHPISVSSIGQIANSFSFLELNGDFFIVGKKNELRNNGIGVLHAPRGLFIYNEPQIADWLPNAEIYPNPVVNRVNISLDFALKGDYQISLLDLSGRVLQQQMVACNSPGEITWEVNTEGLQTGLYLLSLASDNFSVSRKLMVLKD